MALSTRAPTPSQTQTLALRREPDGVRRVGDVPRRRGRLVRRTLIPADLAGLALAFAVAIAVFRSGPSRTDAAGVWSEAALFLLTLPGWVLLAKIHGLYDGDEQRASHTTIDDLVGVFSLATVGAWLLSGGAWLTGLADPYPPKLFAFWALAIVFVVSARAAARAYCRRHDDYVQNALVVGGGDVASRLARTFADHPEYGIRLLRVVDMPGDGTPDDAWPSADLDEIPDLVRRLDVERVVITRPNGASEKLLWLIRRLRNMRVQIDLVPSLFEAVSPNAQIYAVDGVAMIGLPPARLSRTARALKATVDLGLAAAGLVLLAPLLVLIAIGIVVDSRGPVFYRHDRVGLGGRPFRVVKFRTMRLEECTGADHAAAFAGIDSLLDDPTRRREFEETYKLADDPRVTRFGKVLRRTSLDELPQLVNVLLLEMSLVGPRPVTVDELRRYGPHVPTLLSVRPGLTGYWQVNGRSRTRYEDRVLLDVAYVEGWSFKLDWLILGKTCRVLLTGHGAY